MIITLKNKLGCWANERWRSEFILSSPILSKAVGKSWLDLRNRHEAISIDPRSKGRICHWADSSPLTVARIFPELGARLLQQSLQDWPVRFQTSASASELSRQAPDVSIILAIRGLGRLRLLRTVLPSLLAQRDCSVEIIVVEQSSHPEFINEVPSGVRYLHTPIPEGTMPFNRSWALNAGARLAQGRCLILHDADMVVPDRYAASVSERLTDEMPAVRLARYIFYLDQTTSENLMKSHNFDGIYAIDRVVQNNPTPFAVTRKAYYQIGGHDESFFGWGGEDNEFLDRLRTLPISEGSYLPIIHLWHPEAPNRSGDRNAALLQRRLAEPAHERIRKLARMEFGGDTPSVMSDESPKVRTH